jgi:hypothetical protein
MCHSKELTGRGAATGLISVIVGIERRAQTQWPAPTGLPELDGLEGVDGLTLP